MYTYLILNVAFLTTIIIIFRVRPRLPSKPWWVMFISLMLLTLVFDSQMIGLGFFYYAPEKLLGIHIMNAPIEDFFYAVCAAIVVPAMWYKLERK